jgi:hypothetical protein
MQALVQIIFLVLALSSAALASVVGTAHETEPADAGSACHIAGNGHLPE